MDKYDIFPQCIRRELEKAQSIPDLEIAQQSGEIMEEVRSNAETINALEKNGFLIAGTIINSINNLPPPKYGLDLILLDRRTIIDTATSVEEISRILPDTSHPDYYYWLTELLHKMYTLGTKVQAYNDLVEHKYALEATEKNTNDRSKAGKTPPNNFIPFIELINVMVSDIKKDELMVTASRANITEAIYELFQHKNKPSYKSIKKYINIAFGKPAKKGNKPHSAPSLKKVTHWINERYIEEANKINNVIS